MHLGRPEKNVVGAQPDQYKCATGVTACTRSVRAAHTPSWHEIATRATITRHTYVRVKRAMPTTGRATRLRNMCEQQTTERRVHHLRRRTNAWRYAAPDGNHVTRGCFHPFLPTSIWSDRTTQLPQDTTSLRDSFGKYLISQSVVQLPSLAQIHHDVEGILVFEEGLHRHDVGMRSS